MTNQRGYFLFPQLFGQSEIINFLLYGNIAIKITKIELSINVPGIC